MSKWIPCNEYLPGIQGIRNGIPYSKVIFCTDEEVMYGTFLVGLNTGFYDDSVHDESDIADGINYYRPELVNAWMPLPEPYEESLVYIMDEDIDDEDIDFLEEDT